MVEQLLFGFLFFDLVVLFWVGWVIGFGDMGLVFVCEVMEVLMMVGMVGKFGRKRFLKKIRGSYF